MLFKVAAMRGRHNGYREPTQPAYTHTPPFPPRPQVPLGPAGTLPAGQLQWGFAFALPPGLPSNFSYHKGNVKCVFPSF